MYAIRLPLLLFCFHHCCHILWISMSCVKLGTIFMSCAFPWLFPHPHFPTWREWSILFANGKDYHSFEKQCPVIEWFSRRRCRPPVWARVFRTISQFACKRLSRGLRNENKQAAASAWWKKQTVDVKYGGEPALWLSVDFIKQFLTKLCVRMSTYSSVFKPNTHILRWWSAWTLDGANILARTIVHQQNNCSHQPWQPGSLAALDWWILLVEVVKFMSTHVDDENAKVGICVFDTYTRVSQSNFITAIVW